jgi:hypothetical protein
MMGSDLSSNEAAYASGIQAAIDQANGFNIPMYMGEAMWDGATLDYAVQQMDAAGIWWSSWTYTTGTSDLAKPFMDNNHSVLACVQVADELQPIWEDGVYGTLDRL